MKVSQREGLSHILWRGGLLVGSPHLSPDSNPWAPGPHPGPHHFCSACRSRPASCSWTLGWSFTSQKAALQDLRCLLDDYRHWYYMMYYDVWWYYIMILYDIWYMLYDIWYMLYDIWYDIWYMIYVTMYDCVCIVYALCTTMYDSLWYQCC